MSLDKNSAASKTQTFTTKANEVFFRTIQLGRLTSYARRFAYNTGIESAFDIAQEVSKKGMNQTIFNKAKALGLSDDKIRVLQKFKTVDEAFDDEAGKNILNIAGVKASDRDALIPQVGNRLGFSQSKDPLIRSLGQFLSWAQAKTTQTNAIVQRIEDGDAALAVRTLGSLVVYDGLISFKQYLNDPTGKYLPDDADDYLEKTVTREQLGNSIMQAGLSPYYINKMVAIAARPYGSTVSSNISPSFSLIEDYAKLVDQQVGNFQQGDIEGASLQFLRRVPGGKEVEDILAATGNELEDKRKGAKGQPTGRFTRLGFEKGGEVLDVPNVPTEPDQRIDKMTGQPYDQQAGQAFVDKEDPLRRLGFVGGGDVDPLRRLGFGVGGKVLNSLKRGQYQKGSEVRSDMRRSDGSTKSARGYLGPIENNVDGGTMTEFATDMQYKGKSIDVPTMVPTQSKEAIAYMQNMEPGRGWNMKDPMAKEIINKAREHARMRLEQDKSPFYQDGE